MTLAGVLLGLAVGAGLLLVARGLTPANPHLGAALTRLDPDADPSHRRPAGSWRERVGLAAERNLAGRAGFTTPSMDLELIRNITRDPDHTKYTVRWYWTEKASSALAGFVIPLVLALLNRVMGSPFPDVVPVFFSLIGAVYFWFLPDAQIKRPGKRALTSDGRPWPTCSWWPSTGGPEGPPPERCVMLRPSPTRGCLPASWRRSPEPPWPAPSSGMR